jgi:hypothetical protein
MNRNPVGMPLVLIPFIAAKNNIAIFLILSRLQRRGTQCIFIIITQDEINKLHWKQSQQ